MLDKKLEQQDKRLIKVHLKTMIDNRSKLAIDMHNLDTIGSIIQRVAVKKARELNPKKYIILEYNEDQNSQMYSGPMGQNDWENNEQYMEEFGGGYDAFGTDDRIIDPLTIVRNLKTRHIELREKIFVDKPIQKQLGVALEEKNELGFTFLSKKQKLAQTMNQGGMFGSDIYAKNAKGFDSDEDEFETFNEERKGANNLGANQQQRPYKLEEDFLFGQITGSQE